MMFSELSAVQSNGTDTLIVASVVTALLTGFGWLGKDYITSLKLERDKYRDIVLDMLPKHKKTVEDKDEIIEELQAEMRRLRRKANTDV